MKRESLSLQSFLNKKTDALAPFVFVSFPDTSSHPKGIFTLHHLGELLLVVAVAELYVIGRLWRIRHKPEKSEFIQITVIALKEVVAITILLQKVVFVCKHQIIVCIVTRNSSSLDHKTADTLQKGTTKLLTSSMRHQIRFCLPRYQKAA